MLTIGRKLVTKFFVKSKILAFIAGCIAYALFIGVVEMCSQQPEIKYDKFPDVVATMPKLR